MHAVKLTDDQMRTFIRDGYIVVRPNLPRAFHNEKFAKINRVYGVEGNPGNNILPRIPELRHLYDDPVTRVELAGIMGDDYCLDPHRFVHYNQPGSRGRRSIRTHSHAGGIIPGGWRRSINPGTLPSKWDQQVRHRQRRRSAETHRHRRCDGNTGRTPDDSPVMSGDKAGKPRLVIEETSRGRRGHTCTHDL